MKLPLDSKNKECYISDIGGKSPMYTAAVCHRQGGKLLIFFNKQSHCIFESAGRTFCAAQLCMRTLTPAGSFFVPAVRGWGKSHNIKPLYTGGMYGDHTHRVPRGLPKRFHGHPSIHAGSAHQGSAVNTEQSKPQHQSAIRGTCCTHGTSGTNHHSAGGKLL